MAYRCSIPDCRSSHKKGPKVTLFKFPTNKGLRKKWLAAIPHSNFVVDRLSRVCELHFREQDIVRSIPKRISRTGKISSAKLNNGKLKPAAVPCKFPNHSVYLLDTPDPISKVEVLKIEDDVASDELQSESSEEFPEIKTEIVSEELDSQPTCEDTRYNNYPQFLRLFQSFQVPQDWASINDDGKIAIFKLKYRLGAKISYAVVINSDLKLETFLNGREINLCVDHLKTPFVSSDLKQISQLLQIIDRKPKLNDCDNAENLNEIASDLGNVLDHVKDGERGGLTFIYEQLKLNLCSTEHQYSATVITLASCVLTISPHAYRFLRQSGLFTLPHPDTIITKQCKFQTDVLEKEISSSYFQSKDRFLSESERNVILSVNEIHIEPYLDVSKSEELTSIYTFVMESVYANFREITKMLVVSKMELENLHNHIKTIVTDLESRGYHVFCVVTNHNLVNSKAMSNFTPARKLSFVYPHPADKNRPLFFLYDSVHLLKCIFGDWLSPASNEMLNYPDFETGLEKSADFHSLRNLYEFEKDGSIRFEPLNLKDLFLPSTERQDVNLPLRVFNSSVVQHLMQFKDKIGKSEDTADFIHIIAKWWSIINDESIVVTEEANPNFEFLEKMLNWLQNWKDGEFTKTLMPKTFHALHHTIQGMLEITRYCFDELKLPYVPLGKFQVDPLEHRFGKYQQPANGQYYFTAKYTNDTKKTLAIESVLKLKSPTFGDIPISRYYKNIDTGERGYIIEDISDIPLHPTINIDAVDLQKVKGDLSEITVLASYCCFVVLKQLNCQICRQNLVSPKKLIVKNLSKRLYHINKVDLFYPRNAVVQIVLSVYVVFNKILQNFEDELSKCTNKRHFIRQLVLQWVTDEYLIHFRGCDAHSDERLVNIVVDFIINTFLRNYVIGIRNDPRSTRPLDNSPVSTKKRKSSDSDS